MSEFGGLADRGRRQRGELPEELAEGPPTRFVGRPSEAAVVAGMMTTHDALLDRHVANHTWMFLPPGLTAYGDWPDLAGCRAPSPLMVQYLMDDALLPADGMRAAHDLLTDIYTRAGAPRAYVGQFHPGPHRFDTAMQESAFAHLARWLG